MSFPWLDELNDAQRQAVTHGDGPLLVIAGAGTGKTKTLACRVAWLISQGIPADRILLLTFTRRAAAEMLRRAGHLTGESSAARVWGGTFHAVANRLLRIHGQGIGVSPEFTVMDEGDSADLMNLIRGELGLGKTDRRFPRKETIRAIYSRMVNAREKLADVLEHHFPWCKGDADGLRQIFDGYMQRKREQNVLDYDDLLAYWNAMCSADGTGTIANDRFDHVLVDEYQDTNAVQAEILRGMRRRKRNIMAVGDDAQSIYSFRAATIRNILDFPKYFEGTRIVTLEQNYRSTQPILAASNAVIEPARERYTKNLWSDRRSDRKPMLMTCVDENQQCDSVCRAILEHLEVGVPLQRQAVLFRAGHHSDALEVELARRNIPFVKYGGLKFIEAAHIKDMLAFLRVLENPFDEISWFRILQLLDGVGPRVAQRIIDELGVRRPAAATVPGVAEPAGFSPLKRLFERPPTVPPSGRESFSAIRAAFADCCGIPLSNGHAAPHPDSSTNAPDLAAQIERLRQFYDPIFRRIYDNAVVRLRDIDQLQQIAGQYGSRERFISDLTLDPPTATSDLAGPPFLEEDYLILSTIHSAKGCEWDVVHIIHAADGMIPSDMSVGNEDGIEEERRLLYVAMTRAKDALYIYFPLRYYQTKHALGDKHQYAQVSRFLSEPVRAMLDVRGESGATAADAVEPAASVQRVEASLRELWAE